jgi:hypothetical protein
MNLTVPVVAVDLQVDGRRRRTARVELKLDAYESGVA